MPVDNAAAAGAGHVGLELVEQAVLVDQPALVLGVPAVVAVALAHHVVDGNVAELGQHGLLPPRRGARRMYARREGLAVRGLARARRARDDDVGVAPRVARGGCLVRHCVREKERVKRYASANARRKWDVLEKKVLRRSTVLEMDQLFAARASMPKHPIMVSSGRDKTKYRQKPSLLVFRLVRLVPNRGFSGEATPIFLFKRF